MEFDLCFGYGKNLLFENQRIEFDDGDKVLLIGDSKSGKTAIFEFMSGIIGKKSINLNNNAKKIIISFLPSKPVFFENRTVLYNLKYAMRVARMKDVERLNDAVAFADCADKLKTKVKDLSYVEKQILACARAKIKKPDLILIDVFFHNDDQDVDKLINVITKVLNFDCSVVLASRGFVAKPWKFDKAFLVNDHKVETYDSLKDLKKVYPFYSKFKS